MSSRRHSFPDPLPIAVLVSGQGTNLEALFQSVHDREVEIVAVASNVRDAPALRRARRRGVPTRVFPRDKYEHRQLRDEAMASWLEKRGARLVVLAGFMELLTEPFLDTFPDAVINVHPSLLPLFPGLGAIEQAIAARESVFGVTVHYVDAGIDTGPIIAQDKVEIPRARDPREVLEALRPLEHTLLSNAVRTFAADAERQRDSRRHAQRQPARRRHVPVAA
jgi:phosphoribosylglycinamide formyltransferase 1